MSPATILAHFRRFCEKVVGGSVVSKADVISCVKETEAVASLDDYLDEFHSFINKWRRFLDKPVEIVFENRLLGGWSEVSSVTYDPEDDEYSIYVRLYSEYGTEPQYVKDVKEEVIEKEKRIPHLGITVKGEGEVAQNPATDEFVGVAEAWTNLPRDMLKSSHIAPELREAYRKAVDLAEMLANKAREELIIPEWEW